MYVVKTQVLASYLMTKGFRLIKLQKDREDENRNVYLFKNSKELRNAITEFTKQNKK